MSDNTITGAIEQMMAEMQEKYLQELRDLARNYGKQPTEEPTPQDALQRARRTGEVTALGRQGDGQFYFCYEGIKFLAKTYEGLVKLWEKVSTPEPTEEPLTVLCACGAELSIDETMQDEDGGLTIKVRPHDCREYNHAAVRRVCDRLAVLLTGD